MSRLLKAACGWAALMMIVLACSFGGLSEEEQLQTAVAQTLEARQAEEEEETPEPTITIAPTATEEEEPTNTPDPCNDADFVSETVPDGTKFAPNESFTKTWRVRNAGTCTWNTGYEIVFVSGDKMGGPSDLNLTQNVDPGEQVDLKVDLKAPASEGEYEGVWNLRSPDGEYLLNYISVNIEVEAAAPLPPAIALITADYVKSEGGSIRTGGDVRSGLHNVGDTNDNKGSQVFASFDISGIPSGADITKVVVDFTDYDTLGDPFGNLNCLRLYKDDFVPLDAGDYFGGAPGSGLVRWCSEGELSASGADADLISAVQSEVGSDRFEVRIQFNDMATNGDGIGDMVRFGDMKLKITYQ